MQTGVYTTSPICHCTVLLHCVKTRKSQNQWCKILDIFSSCCFQLILCQYNQLQRVIFCFCLTGKPFFGLRKERKKERRRHIFQFPWLSHPQWQYYVNEDAFRQLAWLTFSCFGFLGLAHTLHRPLINHYEGWLCRVGSGAGVLNVLIVAVKNRWPLSLVRGPRMSLLLLRL